MPSRLAMSAGTLGFELRWSAAIGDDFGISGLLKVPLVRVSGAGGFGFEGAGAASSRSSPSTVDQPLTGFAAAGGGKGGGASAGTSFGACGSGSSLFSDMPIIAGT